VAALPSGRNWTPAPTIPIKKELPVLKSMSSMMCCLEDLGQLHITKFIFSVTCLCLLLFSFTSKCGDLVLIPYFRCISTVFHPVFYFDSFSIYCSACYTWSKFWTELMKFNFLFQRLPVIQILLLMLYLGCSLMLSYRKVLNESYIFVGLLPHSILRAIY
jgi:hypothetical protein